MNNKWRTLCAATNIVTQCRSGALCAPWKRNGGEIMKTIEELNEIREKTLQEISLRKDRAYNGKEKHICVCGGTGCTS